MQTFWVILPAGTTIVARGGENAPSFRLVQPAAAFVRLGWESSFLIESLNDAGGTRVETGLAVNYVMQPPENFSQGETVAEAWANFREKNG